MAHYRSFVRVHKIDSVEGQCCSTCLVYPCGTAVGCTKDSTTISHGSASNGVGEEDSSEICRSSAWLIRPCSSPVSSTEDHAIVTSLAVIPTPDRNPGVGVNKRDAADQSPCNARHVAPCGSSIRCAQHLAIISHNSPGVGVSEGNFIELITR